MHDAVPAVVLPNAAGFHGMYSPKELEVRPTLMACLLCLHVECTLHGFWGVACIVHACLLRQM